MFRKYMLNLIEWKNRKSRKPLVIRGARQVGKTYLVRDFAKNHFQNLLEINFDEKKNIKSLFASRDIDKILQLLEIEFNITIIPGKTLIFFDEIQSFPELLSILRYFYERKPDIYIITAGSLLEFTLADHEFSMPVGRIEYLFMNAMSFEEFLLALDEKKLIEFISNYKLTEEFPITIHEKLINYLKLFFIIGGMPNAVKTYIETKKFKEIEIEHKSILQTYKDDFSKYRKRINVERLQNVFEKIPQLVGKKLKYVQIDRNEKAKDLALCIKLLQLARVIYCIKHSAGNGVPLAAESKDSNFKILFMDVGLCASSLGFSLSALEQISDIELINKGAISEQFIGQHILYLNESYILPECYYWNREKKSSSAEIDFLFQYKNKIIPIEVKAGKTGTLRSLHLFVAEKKVNFSVRFNLDKPSIINTTTSIPNLNKQKFKLLSLPLYMVEQLKRLIDENAT